MVWTFPRISLRGWLDPCCDSLSGIFARFFSKIESMYQLQVYSACYECHIEAISNGALTTVTTFWLNRTGIDKITCRVTCCGLPRRSLRARGSNSVPSAPPIICRPNLSLSDTILQDRGQPGPFWRSSSGHLFFLFFSLLHHFPSFFLCCSSSHSNHPLLATLFLPSYCG